MEIRITIKKGVEESYLDSGVMAACCWEKLIPALNVVFRIAENESIVGLKIDENGITVKIES